MISPVPHLARVHRDGDRHTAHPGLIGLNRNERVSPMPAAVFQGIMQQVQPAHLSSYPDLGPLYDRLCRTLDLPEDHLLVTPGSDGAIRRALQVFVDSDDVVVLPTPTYAMYPIYTSIFRGTVRTVAYGADLKLDVEALLAAIAAGCKLVAIANPSQPTGSALAIEDLARIAEGAAAANAICLVDEAYFPFYPHTALPLIRQYDNLLVTRTFSKIGGIAGLRVGYAAGHPLLIESMEKVRGASEVNGVGVVAACYLLDNPDVMATFREEVTEGRGLLLQAAKALGIETPDSHGNFQVLRLPRHLPVTEITQDLEKRGYLVKGGFGAPMQDCIRITLDGPQIMRPFIEALTQAVATVGAAAKAPVRP